MYKSDKIVGAASLVLIVLIIFGFFFLNNSTFINSQKNYKVIVIVKSTSSSIDFWKSFEDGVKTASSECNINYKIEGTPSESMIQQQIGLINNAIKEHPDAILLSATDYQQLVPSARKAVESGISIITTDSDVNYDGKTSFVATDNIKVGEKLGNLLDSHIGTQSKYLIVEHYAKTKTAVDRVNGVLNTVKNSRQRLVDTLDCDTSVKTAKTITENELIKHPEIKGIVATNEVAALGVAQAVKQMGLGGKVSVIACDSSIELIKYMEAGVIQNFVVQRPFNMGYMGIKLASESFYHKKVSPFYDTGYVVINPQNMYTSENQKLLFPFDSSRGSP